MKLSYLVETRPVTIYASDGKRLRTALWGAWRAWNKHPDIQDNIQDAIDHVDNQLNTRTLGGIVVVKTIYNGRISKSYSKIYQAKWGTDNQPFTQFDGLAGTYWQRKLSETSPEATS